MTLRQHAFGSTLAALALFACSAGDDASSPSAAGGTGVTGGTTAGGTGGQVTGGSPSVGGSGGVATGGTGGVDATGGVPSGGTDPGLGGVAGSGGVATGGTDPGTGGGAGGAPDACDSGALGFGAPVCPAIGNDCVPGVFGIYDPPDMPALGYESEHFAFRWDSGVTQADAEAGASSLEAAWSFFVDELGFPEPWCDTADKFKVNVHLDASFGFTGSGTGDRYMAMWINPNGLGQAWVLAHEFTHTLQFSTRGMRYSDYVGWFWESHAQWMPHQMAANRQRTDCADLLVNFPHLYYGSTRNRYCNWQFWEHIKDKYCYQAIHDIWANSPEPGDPGVNEADPFSVLASNLGWSESDLNDEFGEWAMHNATWDYTNPDGTDQSAVYRADWSYADLAGTRRNRVTRLEPLDLVQRRFAVPHAWAPQRWGYNLVRLHPDAGATEVRVTFRGVVQSAPAGTDFGPFDAVPASASSPDSDWRWGLVARDAAGATRYSELQRGADGELGFCVTDADEELWLVVMGTPSLNHPVIWDQPYFTIYRYPWMVEIAGALPGGYQAGAPSPSASGAPHPNGGGWVSSSANVAASAYVGPYAAVLGGTVSDNARIEDQATVLGGTVSGNAVVGGLTLVTNGVTITDSAYVATTFDGLGSFGGGTIGGTAYVLGDVELRASSLTSGVHYGIIESANGPGAALTTPPTEVTAPGPYVWRP